ncbi:UspA domain protein [Methanosalsum zhilinae DSM 4017]|uniref:UspA domain protein n=1 Tax=Methanosalsum zhilinae (strain DSM 4017 / NBRC 107636 / OCM 62 / WeN5) TaxID=679901 RepID=F7XNE8_METZD|nr:universal stress protein [Methanosalsum zhilinae]AEH61198.1 UspA domain protein [Methanosalsum zhilinae DSM 4017]
MEKSFFKKIVIATDGSDNSKYAVETGIKIAGSMGASVDAVHVIHAAWETEVDSELRDEAEKIVGYVEEKGNKENVSVEGVILIGNPAEMLIDYAQKKDADLIVMGTKGMSGIKRFMLGSVAENVVRHSKKPVMVVPKI